MRTIAIGVAAALSLSLSLGAWVARAQPAATAAASDAAAQGAALATQGAAGVAPCASCHGAQGEGQAAAGFPRLTGQSAPYLQRQLDAYAEGYRSNPVMQPIAKAMTPAQRAAAAAHYASLAPVAAATTTAASPTASAPGNASLGRTLATVGTNDQRLQACANCHGPDGAGEWPTYPALAGQHATYLKNALAEWKDGSRRTDPSEQMPRIARSLTPAETDAVVAYFASLPPPAAAETVAAASRTRTGPTVVSGPTRAGAPGAVQGMGTEQGAPLSGGTQGVGSPGNPSGPPSGAPAASSGASAAQRRGP